MKFNKKNRDTGFQKSIPVPIPGPKIDPGPNADPWLGRHFFVTLEFQNPRK